MRLWHTLETAAKLTGERALNHVIRETDIARAAVFLAAGVTGAITKQCLVMNAGLRWAGEQPPPIILIALTDQLNRKSSIVNCAALVNPVSAICIRISMSVTPPQSRFA